MIIFWIFLLHQKLYISPKHLLQELVYSFYLCLAGTGYFPFTSTPFQSECVNAKDLERWPVKELSFKPATHRPKPHSQSLQQRPQSWHFFYCLSESRSVVSDSLPPHGLYSPWTSPSQNTGVSSLSLLQGIIPTQGLNPGLPRGRWILYQLSHKGSPPLSQEEAKSWPSS